MDIKEQLIVKLRNWVEKTNISYDKDIGFRCMEKELTKLRDGKEKEIYKVSFQTEDKIEYDKNGEIISLFEGMYCFAYFDAETLELLYIMKKAGYIEVNSSY